MKTQFDPRFLLTLACILLLAACGGGGDSVAEGSLDSGSEENRAIDDTADLADLSPELLKEQNQAPPGSTMEMRLQQTIDVLDQDPGPDAVDSALDNALRTLYGGLRILPSTGTNEVEQQTEQWNQDVNQAEMELAGALEEYANEPGEGPKGRALDLKLFIEEMNEAARAIGEATRECGAQNPQQGQMEANGPGCEQLLKLLNEENGHLFAPPPREFSQQGDLPPGPPFPPGYTVKLRSPAIPTGFTPAWEEDIINTGPLAPGECSAVFKETRGLMIQLHYRGITVVRDPWANPNLPRGTIVPIWVMEWVPSQYIKTWNLCNNNGTMERIAVDQRVKQDLALNFFWKFFPRNSWG